MASRRLTRRRGHDRPRYMGTCGEEMRTESTKVVGAAVWKSREGDGWGDKKELN